MNNIKRINIIGPPGSGKSTLARELATLYNLPIVHMDLIAHTDKYNAMTNRPAFLEKIEEESKKDEWIMEGVYKSTLKYRLPKADMTIYLDLSKRIYAYRVLKRRVQYRNKVRDEMPAGWKEKIDPEFMKYVLTFHKQQKPFIDEELCKYDGKKIFTLKKTASVKKFIEGLKND